MLLAKTNMSTVDPNQRFVSPLQGTGLSLFVVSIVGGVSSLIVVGLRTYHRLQRRNFSLDDGLMLGGLVSNTLDTGIYCRWGELEGIYMVPGAARVSD